MTFYFSFKFQILLFFILIFTSHISCYLFYKVHLHCIVTIIFCFMPNMSNIWDYECILFFIIYCVRKSLKFSCFIIKQTLASDFLLSWLFVIISEVGIFTTPKLGKFLSLLSFFLQNLFIYLFLQSGREGGK